MWDVRTQTFQADGLNLNYLITLPNDYTGIAIVFPEAKDCFHSFLYPILAVPLSKEFNLIPEQVKWYFIQKPEKEGKPYKILEVTLRKMSKGRGFTMVSVNILKNKPLIPLWLRKELLELPLAITHYEQVMNLSLLSKLREIDLRSAFHQLRIKNRKPG